MALPQPLTLRENGPEPIQQLESTSEKVDLRSTTPGAVMPGLQKDMQRILPLKNWRFFINGCVQNVKELFFFLPHSCFCHTFGLTSLIFLCLQHLYSAAQSHDSGVAQKKSSSCALSWSSNLMSLLRTSNSLWWIRRLRSRVFTANPKTQRLQGSKIAELLTCDRSQEKSVQILLCNRRLRRSDYLLQKIAHSWQSSRRI